MPVQTTAWLFPGTKVLYAGKDKDDTVPKNGVVLQPKKNFAVVLLDDGKFVCATSKEITLK